MADAASRSQTASTSRLPMHASCRHRRRGRLPSRAGDGAGSGSPSGDEVITPRRFSSAAKPVMKPVMKPVTPRCKLLENVEYVRTRGGVSGSQRDYLSALFDSVTFALYGALQIGSVAYFRHDRQARCVSSGNLLQRNSIAPLALGRGPLFFGVLACTFLAPQAASDDMRASS
jgi:hypothetical protein